MKTNETDHHHDHPRFRERLFQAIVQPVPDGLALCEFECSKTECSMDEWRSCKRRLEALSPCSGRAALFRRGDA
ncbi:hypothetical protein [Luteolibacter soli]|uniref:Uncharacterized protein n=1 Tax=Luteolibacter soli TaxID=3135280 RepID=A0ABU9AY73_9BACT